MRATWGWLLLVFVVGCAATTVGTTMDGGATDVVPSIDVLPLSDVPPADDDVTDVAVPLLPFPRPIAPLSTATVTSQTPTLRWALAMASDGAHVQICRDRACGTVEQTLDVTGTQTTVPTALTEGVHFWRLAARTGTTVGTVWSPTWELFVGYRSAPVDASWGTVPDFNGDGFADVVVGGIGRNTYVYLGSASGLSAIPITFMGLAPEFGWSVASAGDVNGDGFADLVVGSPSNDLVYVYLGSASGLSGIPLTITGSAGNNIGASVASAGDVNADGYADLVVGSADDGFDMAYVYLGSASGPAATPTIVTGPSGSTNFGFSVASTGDVNGDGFADVVVGTGASNTVYVYLGSASGLSATSISLSGPGGLIDFGASVTSAGDVSGDGFADLVVGTGASNTAYVYLGSASGLSATPITLGGPAGSEGFGISVARAGDVNGDGFADLVVGADESNTAYVYLGSASGLTATPITLMGPTGSFYYGFSVANAGDGFIQPQPPGCTMHCTFNPQAVSPTSTSSFSTRWRSG